MKKQIIVRALPVFLSSCVLFLCFSCRFCWIPAYTKGKKMYTWLQCFCKFYK